MISIHDLTMAYTLKGETITVLDRATLTVDPGDSVAIVGPSGSGKTTLLLLLAGLEQPVSGSVAINGVDLTTLDADALADLRRDRVGIIFQSFHLIGSLTALGNVALPLEIAGHDDARTRAHEMLERVGLGHRERHYPSQLSGGEQQRVAIARALVHRPALVLADEPTGNLDKRTGQQVSDILFDLHDRLGSTLVMVTHDEAVARRCGRRFYIDEGRLSEPNPNAISA
jgi:putative ABC transport system ATP-binding protein